MSDIELNSIGNFCYGGYLAGYIDVYQSKYALIVSPKEFETKLKLKTSDTSTPRTQSVSNGWYNTLNMNDDAHPAAKYCVSLSIGEYNDWYLPARDELEICYRSFKPTTDTNNTSTTRIPQGNGYNTNSSPVGAAYTSSVPGQTSVTAFRSGGTEAFNTSYYWSSTEYGSDSTTSWVQIFSDGTEFNPTKRHQIWVRAVRRVAV
jgi:hypothetical protein